jgi:glycosyltransferase involved in cell wall biosynthesis
MSVSVALCTHDGERFIEQQLLSILAQGPTVSQIVVSDDESSDSTVVIAAAALEEVGAGPTVCWIKNCPPLGVTKNFEGAIAATDGDVVALSDQDDVWHEGKLKQTTRMLEDDPGALLVFTDARLVDVDGTPAGNSLFESLGISEGELGMVEQGDAVAVFLRRNIVTGATVVFRRELFERAQPFPSSWVHDEWLAMVAAIHGGVRVLRAETIDYRQHGANVIGVNDRTLAYKVRRMLQPRGTRNADLARKFADLEAWVRTTGQSADLAASVAAKARFERARADMPKTRIARIPAITRLAARGLYARFASQGRLDIVRDLLQPA